MNAESSSSNAISADEASAQPSKALAKKERPRATESRKRSAEGETIKRCKDAEAKKRKEIHVREKYLSDEPEPPDSAFKLYVDDRRRACKAHDLSKMPSAMQEARQIAEDWKNLTEAAKQVYTERHELLRKDYEAKLHAFNARKTALAAAEVTEADASRTPPLAAETQFNDELSTRPRWKKNVLKKPEHRVPTAAVGDKIPQDRENVANKESSESTAINSATAVVAQDSSTSTPPGELDDKHWENQNSWRSQGDWHQVDEKHWGNQNSWRSRGDWHQGDTEKKTGYIERSSGRDSDNNSSEYEWPNPQDSWRNHDWKEQSWNRSCGGRADTSAWSQRNRRYSIDWNRGRDNWNTPRDGWSSSKSRWGGSSSWYDEAYPTDQMDKYHRSGGVKGDNWCLSNKARDAQQSNSGSSSAPKASIPATTPSETTISPPTPLPAPTTPPAAFAEPANLAHKDPTVYTKPATQPLQPCADAPASSLAVPMPTSASTPRAGLFPLADVERWKACQGQLFPREAWALPPDGWIRVRNDADQTVYFVRLHDLHATTDVEEVWGPLPPTNLIWAHCQNAFFKDLAPLPTGWIRLLSRSKAGRIYFLRLEDGTNSFEWPGEVSSDAPAQSVRKRKTPEASFAQTFNATSTLPDCRIARPDNPCPRSSQGPPDMRMTASMPPNVLECQPALGSSALHAPGGILCDRASQFTHFEECSGAMTPNVPPRIVEDEVRDGIFDNARTSDNGISDGAMTPHVVVRQPESGSPLLSLAPGNFAPSGSAHPCWTHTVQLSGSITPNIPP